MKIMVRARGTGKTKELFETAKQNDAIIITSNKKSLNVKAESYGYYNLKIIDYEDLVNSNYNLGTNFLVHNADSFLKWICKEHYNLNLIGFTATLED